MKKIIILMIILIAYLYVSTGRYEVVQRNIIREGWSALIEEPFWIGGWIAKKIGYAKENIDESIDGSRLQEEDYEKLRDKVRYAE